MTEMAMTSVSVIIILIVIVVIYTLWAFGRHYDNDQREISRNSWKLWLIVIIEIIIAIALAKGAFMAGHHHHHHRGAATLI